MKDNELLVIANWIDSSYVCDKYKNLGYEIKDPIRIEGDWPLMKVAIWFVKKGFKWEFNFTPSKKVPYLRPEIKANNKQEVEKKLRIVHPTATIIWWLKQQLIDDENEIIQNKDKNKGYTKNDLFWN